MGQCGMGRRCRITIVATVFEADGKEVARLALHASFGERHTAHFAPVDLQVRARRTLSWGDIQPTKAMGYSTDAFTGRGGSLTCCSGF